WKEQSLLMRVAVDRIVDEVRADAAIVEQSVALGGRAVPHNRDIASLAIDEERQQLSLGFAHALGKVSVGLDLRDADRVLLGDQARHARGLLTPVVRMAGVDA